MDSDITACSSSLSGPNNAANSTANATQSVFGINGTGDTTANRVTTTATAVGAIGDATASTGTMAGYFRCDAGTSNCPAAALPRPRSAAMHIAAFMDLRFNASPGSRNAAKMCYELSVLPESWVSRDKAMVVM